MGDEVRERAQLVVAEAIDRIGHRGDATALSPEKSSLWHEAQRLACAMRWPTLNIAASGAPLTPRAGGFCAAK